MPATQELPEPGTLKDNLALKIRELEARIAQLEAEYLPRTRQSFDPKEIEPAFGSWGNGEEGKKEVRRSRDESEKRRKRMKL